MLLLTDGSWGLASMPAMNAVNWMDEKKPAIAGLPFKPTSRLRQCDLHCVKPCQVTQDA